MIRTLTLCALALLLIRAVVVATRPTTDPPTRGPVVIEMSVWGMPFENALYTDLYIPDFERENPDIRVLDASIDGPDGIDREDFIPILWDAVRFDGRRSGVPQEWTASRRAG